MRKSVLGIDLGTTQLAAALLVDDYPLPEVVYSYAESYPPKCNQQRAAEQVVAFLLDVWHGVCACHRDYEGMEWEWPSLVVAEEAWLQPAYGADAPKRKNPNTILPLGAAAGALVAFAIGDASAHLLSALYVARETGTRTANWTTDALIRTHGAKPDAWRGKRGGQGLWPHIASAIMLAEFGLSRYDVLVEGKEERAQ